MMNCTIQQQYFAGAPFKVHRSRNRSNVCWIYILLGASHPYGGQIAKLERMLCFIQKCQPNTHICMRSALNCCACVYQDVPQPTGPVGGLIAMAAIWPRNWCGRGEAQQLGITCVGLLLRPFDGLRFQAAIRTSKSDPCVDTFVRPRT